MAGDRRRRRLTFRAQLERLEPRWTMSGLIQASDLNYLGAFKLPSGTFGASTFEYGGTALTYNPTNNSLFMVGHDWHQAVAEVSIPTLRTGSLSNLGTASVLQPFVDVLGRAPNRLTDPNPVKVGGLLVADNELVGTAYAFYDAEGDALLSHFKVSSLDLAGGNVSGLFQVGTLGGGYVGGYMATVPVEWQDELGVQYLTGQAGLSIISRTSAGPALFGFNPDQLGTLPATATPLVYYPLANPLAPETTQNPYFNLTTEIKGVVFPEGTDSVLFFGSHGTGPYWYGEANEGGNVDPYRNAKGPHAPPYAYQVWAYDIHDLIAVKNGQMLPWQAQPYDVWTFDLPYPEGAKHIGGVGYDAASGRLYVSQQHGAANGMPVIHAYQVGTPAADTQPPVVSAVASANVTATAAMIHWTTDEASDTQVEYGTTTSYGSSTTLNTAAVTSHSANLTGLAANTTYHFRVKSRDAAGNLAVSGDFLFTTPAADVTAPVLSGIGSSAVSSSGATIAWTTNEASDTQVEYGTTTSYGSSSALNAAAVTSHSVNLTGLAANTTYHYRVKSRDAAGNLAVSGDFTLTTAASSPVYSYANPPPLPPSNPANTVSVSTVSQLINAINNLQTGQTISLAAGTYNLSGVTDALYVPQGISNWTIRGATGNRADVVIVGAGMSGSVRYGFWIGNSTGGTIADLTIRNIREHGIIMNPGVHDFLCHNVEMVDIGDQFIKSNPVGFGNGNDNGVVEYSVFRYTTNEAGGGSTANYSQGVDVHAGDNWTIRYNKFENFFAPAGGGIWGMAAVLVWNGAQNTVVEGNVFVNNARDIILGLEDKAAGNDHAGGVIRNNTVYRNATSQGAEWDVPISAADSPNTKIYHNTVLINGSFPYAVQYRFAATANVDIRNNLADAGIWQRDGATGLVANNVTNATASYFTAPASGDLHLLSTASAAIDKGVFVAGETYDIDGLARPFGSAPDIGADEFGNTAITDTTAPTISGVATSNVSATGVTIAWTTDEAADTQIQYGLTTAYGSSTALNTALVTSHSVNLTGLAASTTYHFRVRSRDAAGNLRTSGDFTFTTAAAPDTTAPTISNVGSSGITTSGAVINWLTNEAADSQVQYGLTTSYGSTTSLNTALVTSHTVNLTGLAANTTYHFRVRSRDAAGNLRTSGDFMLTTASEETIADWGTIQFKALSNQNLAGGEAWYQLTSSRAGLLTVEALFAHSAGNIDLALLDANRQLLDSSNSTTDYERVQVAAPAAGTVYLLRVTGANSSVDFRLANLVRKTGSTVEVAGTSGDDELSFKQGARLAIVVNGVAYDFARQSVTIVNVDGGLGDDRFQATLGAADDRVTFRVGSVDVASADCDVHAASVETIEARGGGGLDKAWLYDSAGNDTLQARPTSVVLAGAGYENTASRFEKTYTFADAGGVDVATLFDSSGKDYFKAGSLKASLSGPGFYNWVRSFDEVIARATAGGWDRANFYGTAGNELLETESNVRTFTGDGFKLVAEKLEKVSVYSGGGNDRAEFRSLKTGNKFVGRDARATVKVGKRITRISNFAVVNAYALEGERPTVDVQSLDYLFTTFGDWKTA